MVPIGGLVLSELRAQGLYTREHETRLDGHSHRTFDAISNAPMATEFAISRFLTPIIAREGWALFADADVMARVNLHALFDKADSSKACMVVKHDHKPTSSTKMDGQAQTSYERKNWSSVVLWNCDHPGARALTVKRVNEERGLWLHQFSWLDDSDIGELHPRWNYLVGHSDPSIQPALVHFTDGTPSIPGYEDVAFADEWRSELEYWAR